MGELSNKRPDWMTNANTKTPKTGEPGWYAPPQYIEAARKALGEIELDPASSDIAQETVQTHYFTVAADGLNRESGGCVWHNPPCCASGDVGQVMTKLAQHGTSDDVTAACVLVNNATDTGWFQNLGAHAAAICFPRERVRFVDEAGNEGSPQRGQAVLYLGREKERFVSAFKEFGVIFERCCPRDDEKPLS